jgi:TRAP-type C4-dicarboxylate transport system permease small subunit
MTTDTDPPQETGLIHSAIRYVNLALLALGCVFLLLMMAHITVDVFVRYVFNGVIVGTLETVSFYYVVLAVFLPLGYVELRNEHIRVDLFAQMMPGWAQLALYVLSCIAGLVFFGMLMWQSGIDAIRSTIRAETIMSNFLFYIWPSRWALPVGFAGMCLAILSNLLRAIQRRQAL